MGNIQIITPSRAALGPALALALCTSLAQPLPVEAAMPALTSWNEGHSISPSSPGVFSMRPASSEISFEDRLTTFYTSLSNSQHNLEMEDEQLILANLSALYED